MAEPTVCATILTGGRPDLLRRTLAASSEVIERCDAVHAHSWKGDEETAAVLREMLNNCVHGGSGLANGPAVSACARYFLDSGCDVWLHLEDDWELMSERAALEPDWFDVAVELVKNTSIGQVRLREVEHLGSPITIEGKDGVRFAFDGSGASNRNWVSGTLVEWRTHERWPFMAGPAHLTFNPFMMGRSMAEQVFWAPVENELHAMDRFHAARTGEGRPLVAQLRPGVYSHIGEGRHIGEH
jgi:hypothetical protein